MRASDYMIIVFFLLILTIINCIGTYYNNLMHFCEKGQVLCSGQASNKQQIAILLITVERKAGMMCVGVNQPTY